MTALLKAHETIHGKRSTATARGYNLRRPNSNFPRYNNNKGKPLFSGGPLRSVNLMNVSPIFDADPETPAEIRTVLSLIVADVATQA